MKNDFAARLNESTDLLEETEAAPGWLAKAVRAGLAHAKIFAPRKSADDPPPDFYYPH